MNAPQRHERRQELRIRGPFDGYRVGLIDVPLQIYDLSAGGCFINSMQEAPKPGRPFSITIELGEYGTISAEVETAFAMSEFGYEVRFVALSERDRANLVLALARLLKDRQEEV